MPDVPLIFRQRISRHNRSCWLAAGASALLAGLLWMVYGALFTGAVLLSDVIRTWDVDLTDPPRWFFPLGFFLAGMLLIGAGVDRCRRRYRALSDRRIIGWHLVPEVLFFPAKMTFAIGDHLGARIRLSRNEIREAWRILRVVWQRKRADVSQLAGELSDRRLLKKILPALQMTDWIDLHSDEGNWYYRVRTDQEALLNEWVPRE